MSPAALIPIRSFRAVPFLERQAFDSGSRAHSAMDSFLIVSPPRPPSKFTDKQIAAHYFVCRQDDNGDPTDYWLCRQCGVSRKKSNGYGNLASHVKTKHDDYSTRMEKEGLSSFVTTRALQMYEAINWVTATNLPLNFFEHDLTKKYTKLECFERRTLKKCMLKLCPLVEAVISNALPAKFGVCFDGWSHNSEHFVGVFACFLHDSKRDEALLGIAPLLDSDDDDLSAASHIKFLEYILSLYKRTLADVIYMVADNSSVNTCISKAINIPMVGCASHRLNLASQQFLKASEPLIDKVHKLMVKIKNSAYDSYTLRANGGLRPVVRQSTRWSSTFLMLKRMVKIMPALVDMSPEVEELIPTDGEMKQLTALLARLRDLESASKKLQDATLDMAQCRALLNAVIDLFPSMASHLAADAPIVKWPDFERGCCKILDGERLSESETRAMSAFVTGGHARAGATSTSARLAKRVKISSSSKAPAFAEKVLQQHANRTAKYDRASVTAIPPTSNTVERLFSAAKAVLSPQRQGLHPQTLEAILFLRLNKRFWSVATVASALDGVAHEEPTMIEETKQDDGDNDDESDSDLAF